MRNFETIALYVSNRASLDCHNAYLNPKLEPINCVFKIDGRFGCFLQEYRSQSRILSFHAVFNPPGSDALLLFKDVVYLVNFCRER